MKHAQSKEPLSSAPSVADVLCEFHSLDLPIHSLDMKPLDKEVLQTLDRVLGYADPMPLSGQITSALHVLWCAQNSGELPDDHVRSMIWALAELTSLLEKAIDAHARAAWWKAQHRAAVAARNSAAERHDEDEIDFG